MSILKANRIENLTTTDGGININNSGNVGIGTSSPSAALEIVQTSDMAVFASTTGTNNSARFEARSGNGTTSGKYAYVRFNNNDTNNQRYDIGTYGTDNLTFRDVKAGSTRMTLDTSGNVGINTTSPTFPSGTGVAIHHTVAPRLKFTNDATGQTSSDGQHIFSNNLDFVFENKEAGNMRFYNNGSERARFDTSGRLLLGTTTEGDVNADDLTIANSGNCGMTIRSGASNSGSIFFSDGTSGVAEYQGQILYDHNNNYMRFQTGASERMRIDSSGRLLSGTTSAPGTVGGFSHVNIKGTSINANGAIGLYRNTASPSAGQGIGAIYFANSDGNAGAYIQGQSDGTWGTNDYPGRLIFFTTADGASSATERMRIASDGLVSLSDDLLIKGDSSKIYGNVANGASGPNNSYIEMYSSNNGDMTFATTYSTANFIWKNGTTPTERMRVNSSGMLQVGGTTSADNGNKVEITSSSGGTIGFLRNDTSTVQGDPIGAIGFYGNDSNGTYQDAARIEVNADGDHATGDKPAKIEFKVSADGGNTPIQRFIIESDGEQRMFSANPSYTLVLNNGASAGTSYLFLEGRHSATSNTGQTGTRSLSITTNGNIYNTNNSYGQISDVKLKENIVNASSQWDDIKGVQVRNFNFKEETGHPTHTQIGVVAQELETVSPGLVYDTPDVDADRNDLGTVTKTVNYSVLYMKAVKALQEAQTRIEALETQQADLLARITALETA